MSTTRLNRRGLLKGIMGAVALIAAAHLYEMKGW